MASTTIFLPIVVRPPGKVNMENWPPPTAPAWPPPEMGTTWASFSDIRVLVETLRGLGFTLDQPTAQERNLFFRDARCEEGHNVLGRMVVSPGGTRYPFAACVGIERELLCLWPPYSCGFDSGRET